MKCMKKIISLASGDRKYLDLVTRAIRANPFSDERLELDARLAGTDVEGLPPVGRTMELFMPCLEARLKRIEDQGAGQIQDFAGEDRKIMEYAWLFFTYHRYVTPLDKLIRTQLADGDRPSQVPFARDVISDLRVRGFSRTEAERFLALFYQLRRAFHFIVKHLVGRSPCMKALRLSLWNSVFTHDIFHYERWLWNRLEDFSTLLLGETGTGKGTAAAAIGRSGFIPYDDRGGAFAESFTRTFMTINLSQYPESLIESELFGHRKGAFTGAVDHHEGVFARSSAYGALFLDEIGEVGEPVQIKLLKVLEERTFAPVGSHDASRFEGRVIAATNRPLEKLRSEGGFRDDFFYRLSSDVIEVPSLRRRIAEDPAELDDLIALTVKRIVGEEDETVIGLVREALALDLPGDYDWPGNVRELEQAVRRILLTGTYRGEAKKADATPLAGLLEGVERGDLSARDLLARYCALIYDRVGRYEEVARRTGLDRRTVKKHVERGKA